MVNVDLLSDVFFFSAEVFPPDATATAFLDNGSWTQARQPPGRRGQRTFAWPVRVGGGSSAGRVRSWCRPPGTPG
jgi:hypothetical protein